LPISESIKPRAHLANSHPVIYCVSHAFSFLSGSEPYGVDVIHFRPLTAGGSCLLVPHYPNCTAVSTSDLPWHLHGRQHYYVTLKAMNLVGLYVLATAGPYLHNVQLASEGVVFDTAITSPNIQVTDLDL